MRLVTFNVLHGRSTEDGRVDPGRLRRAVSGLGADVLALQEVDRGQPRSSGLHLSEVAAEAMGARHWRFVPAMTGTPGSTWTAVRGDIDAGAGSGDEQPAYGVALLSRLPVRSWEVVRLPAAPAARTPIVIPGRRKPLLLKDEPRVGVIAVVDAPFAPLTVATTHLSFLPGWGVAQLWRLTARLHALPGPQILMGDLNMPSVARRLLPTWRSLADAATFPAAAPRVQIDHVLGRGALPAVRHVEAPRMELSDHRALIVDLDC